MKQTDEEIRLLHNEQTSRSSYEERTKIRKDRDFRPTAMWRCFTDSKRRAPIIQWRGATFQQRRPQLHLCERV